MCVKLSRYDKLCNWAGKAFLPEEEPSWKKENPPPNEIINLDGFEETNPYRFSEINFDPFISQPRMLK